MSKSNATEIIAILYAILTSLVHNHWLQWALVFLVAENVIESMYWSYKEHKS